MAVASDFSQAEKEKTACKAKEINKMTQKDNRALWPTKDSEHCIFIALLILLPHDLNDSKLFQMTSIDLLDT